MSHPDRAEKWQILLLDIDIKKAGPAGSREIDFQLIIRKFGHLAQHGQTDAAEAGTILGITDGGHVLLSLGIERRIQLRKASDFERRIGRLLGSTGRLQLLGELVEAFFKFGHTRIELRESEC